MIASDCSATPCILGLEHGSFHKTLMLLIYLLSVLTFARLWFITILDMPAYAPLTVREGLYTVFSSGLENSIVSSFLKVPRL